MPKYISAKLRTHRRNDEKEHRDNHVASATKTTTRKRNMIMKNVNLTVSPDGKTATIVLDLTKDFGKSKSGKSTVVATTEGNASIPGTDLKIGVNVYR
jgi:hypothetical protein